MNTVEPHYKDTLGPDNFVHRREVVHYSEVESVIAL